MKKHWRKLLIVVMVVSFGIAAWYPIKYELNDRNTEATMQQLQAMRNAGLGQEETAQPAGTHGEVREETQGSTEGELPEGDGEEREDPVAEKTAEPTDAAGIKEEAERETVSASVVPEETEGAGEAAVTPAPTGTPEPTAEPTPTPEPTINRFDRTGAVLTYEQKEKVELDEAKILPQYRELYEANHDLVGWITIPGSVIDYPVVQTEDSEYYLTHDFFGTEDSNGQIILDTNCDAYTPSYNLVISGHNMRTKKMFGSLASYQSKNTWKKQKIVYFDTLMEHKEYVVFAAFYSADYDEDEEGFRYNVDIQYIQDAKQWLRDIKEYQLYDTGIDAEFGDEFLTLTTCNKQSRKDGRFVVVCRRIREGEEIE